MPDGKAKDPAFLFYPKDFLLGVANLTMEERGQYITLLCLQHQNGHLSKKTIWLALGSDLVIENSDVLKKFSVDVQGFYYQHRLEEEIEKRFKAAETHRIAGRKGGAPKRNHKVNQKVIQKGGHKGTQTGNGNGNGNVDKPKKNPYGKFQNIMLTDSDYADLINSYSEGVVKRELEKASAWQANNPMKKNHHAFMVNWILRNDPTPQGQPQGTGYRRYGDERNPNGRPGAALPDDGKPY
jgi:hypothetical protein